jgi:hypothetical protein
LTIAQLTATRRARQSQRSEEQVLDRLGGWLDRRRVLAYCSLLLAAEIALTGYFVAATHGWLWRLEAPVATDFVSFYAAGTLADAGTPRLAYDRAAHFAAEQRVREPGIDYNFFFYPPVFLLLCAALAKLPYLVAFLAFEGLTLALFLVVVVRILGERSPEMLLPVIAFPVVFWNFGWGQNGFLTAALMGAGTLLADRRPVAAGLAFGAVCYKPQFGLLIPLALAAGGNWRAFVAATAGTAGLILLSLWAFGLATWQAFFAAALGSPATYAGGGAKFSAFVTPFGAVMLLGGDPTLAWAVQAAATLAVAAFVVFTWRSAPPQPLRGAVLTAAALIATPLAMTYDLTLGAVAVAWLYRARGGIVPSGRLVLAAAYLALFAPVQIGDAWHVPIAAAAAAALLAVVACRVIREYTGDAGHPAATGGQS